MKLGFVLIAVVALIVIGIVWLVDHPIAIEGSRNYEAPAPNPVVKKPTPVVQRKAVKHTVPAVVAEPAVPQIAETPKHEPTVVHEPPRPFPDAAEIPVGVDKGALSPFHEPTLRTFAVDHRQLKETYVYCPGGATDTWGLLKNGKVTEKFALEHIPPERAQ